jgi:murein peptide amidase A
LRVHLSAGIHGDEPASSEALLHWVETNPDRAHALDLLVFPCLNPWGLVHNKREDEHGRDLNRCYHLSDVEPIRSHASSLRGRRFDLALLLHEDYEAHGVYLYETSMRRPPWGEHIIRAMEPHIGADHRTRIDGSRARRGIVRRRITPSTMPEWPEAFLLHFHHASRTFTVETPSEADLASRVRAHCAAIDAALDLAAAALK